MIKQSVFEEELIAGMQQELARRDVPDLTKAAECLHGALEIFEASQLTVQANQVLAVMFKIAQKADRHTKGLTPAKEVANLKNHGTVFNMADTPPMKAQLTKDDMEADFADMLDSPSFDFGASDDELMGMEVKDDELEVFDKNIPLNDFEEEKD